MIIIIMIIIIIIIIIITGKSQRQLLDTNPKDIQTSHTHI